MNLNCGFQGRKVGRTREIGNSSVVTRELRAPATILFNRAHGILFGLIKMPQASSKQRSNRLIVGHRD
jgi:hypothetical protein